MPRNLRLLGAAQFVSQAGDGLYMAVILNYALRVSGGDKASVGLVSVCENLPYVLFGLWAGVLVDRWDRRRTMLGADLLRAAVLVLLFAADRGGWLGGVNPSAALPVAGAAFLLSVGTLFFNPARDAVLPDLAEGGDLLKANAAVGISQYGALLVGPLLAALLLAFRPPAEAFLWDAGTFLVSFACVLAIRVPAKAKAAAPIRMDVAGALRYARSRSDLMALLLMTVFNNVLLMGPAIVGSVFLVRGVAELGGPFLGCSPEAMYGIYLSCFAAGLIVGVSLLRAFGGARPRWWLLGIGILFDGLTFLPFAPVARTGSFPLLMATIFVHALPVPMILVVRPAMLQAHVPRERLGQVFALVNLTVQGVTALSVALAGILCNRMAPGDLFTMAGIGGTLAGVLALTLRPLRRLV